MGGPTNLQYPIGKFEGSKTLSPEERSGAIDTLFALPQELGDALVGLTDSQLVNLVLYCRSRNSFVSAPVAVAMRKHGIHNIHVLAGGLEAWKGLGFPLTEQFADVEAEVARLGMEVSPPWKHIPPRKP
jgi:3-mercaptopyruvate sulfurtransferase SseA